jgi:hypothetical protein
MTGKPADHPISNPPWTKYRCARPSCPLGLLCRKVGCSANGFVAPQTAVGLSPRNHRAEGGLAVVVLVELLLEIGLRIQDIAKAGQGNLKLPEERRAYCDGGGTENPILNSKTALCRLRGW